MSEVPGDRLGLRYIAAAILADPMLLAPPVVAIIIGLALLAADIVWG